MTRSIRLLLALAVMLPVGACSMDPNGPDLEAGQLCGSAAPSDGSCLENVPQADWAR
jgi:hypothetical protein